MIIKIIKMNENKYKLESPIYSEIIIEKKTKKGFEVLIFDKYYDGFFSTTPMIWDQRKNSFLKSVIKNRLDYLLFRAKEHNIREENTRYLELDYTVLKEA